MAIHGESRPPLIPKKTNGSMITGTPKRLRPKSFTPTGRRSSCSSQFTHEDDFSRSMAELDETVASIGADSASSVREEGSVSTDFGHNVLTHRLALNMDQVLCDGNVHRRSRSVSSRSVSSRRSKRGESLERLIYGTITISYGLDNSDDPTSADHTQSISTEDILRDLRQADAVLRSEIASMSSSKLLPPPVSLEDEPNLLPPPLVSSVLNGDDTCLDWNPNQQDSSVGTSHPGLTSHKSQSSNATSLFEAAFDAWPLVAFDVPSRPHAAAGPRPDDPTSVQVEQRFQSSLFGNSFESQAFSSTILADDHFDPSVVTDFSMSENPFHAASKQQRFNCNPSPTCVAGDPWF